MSIAARMNFPFWALVRRDLLRTLRQWQSLVYLLPLLLYSSFVVLRSFPRLPVEITYAPVISSVVVGESFTLWHWIAAFILPAHAALSFSQEQHQPTFDAILLTSISPQGLVLSVVVNTFGFFLLLLAASLPVYSTALLVAGLDIEAVLVTFLLVASTGFLSATLGAWCSVLFRKAYFSLPAVVALTHLVLLGIPKAFLFLYTTREWAWVSYYIPKPFWLLSSPYTFHPSSSQSPMHYLSAALLHVLLALVVLGVAMHSLRRRIRRRCGSVPASSMKQFKDSLFEPDIVPFPPIPDEAPPLYEREVRWEGVARPRRRLLLNIYVICMSLFIALSISLEHTRNMRILADLTEYGFTLLGILCPLVCATKISRECKSGQLEHLRMTLISPSDLLRAKRLAATTSIWPALVTCIVCYPLTISWVHSSPSDWTFMVTAIMSLTVSAWFLIHMSLLISSFCRRPFTSLVTTFLFTYMLLVLLRPAVNAVFDFACNILWGFYSTGSEHYFDALEKLTIFLMPTSALFENIHGIHVFDDYAVVSIHWIANLALLLLTGFLFRAITRRRMARLWAPQP